MTGQREIARYATASLKFHENGCWWVHAQPYNEPVGVVQRHDAGWTATTRQLRYAGLWPTKQAAAEVLVKQAGYELERS